MICCVLITPLLVCVRRSERASRKGKDKEKEKIKNYI